MKYSMYSYKIFIFIFILKLLVEKKFWNIEDYRINDKK